MQTPVPAQTQPEVHAAQAPQVLPPEPIPTRYANSPVGPGEFAVEKAMGARCTEDNWAYGGYAELMHRYCVGEIPKTLRQVMLTLPENEISLHLAHERQLKDPVTFIAVRGLGRDPDFLVEAPGWWIRSFGSSDPAKTVYWVGGSFKCRGIGYEHLRAATRGDVCASGAMQSRLYRLKGEGALVDVTLDVLPPDPVITSRQRRHFDRYGGGNPYLDPFKLQYVPVLRWMMDFDPDESLPDSDPHWFASGAHLGFLVWDGERFTLQQRVPRRLWPCQPVNPGDAPCSQSGDSLTDKFVIDEPQSTAKEAAHDR
jgi:hypothetical protein